MVQVGKLYAGLVQEDPLELGLVLGLFLLEAVVDVDTAGLGVLVQIASMPFFHIA